MSDLIGFLLARIAEDEAVAKQDEADRQQDFGKPDPQLHSALENVNTVYMDYPAIAIDSTRVLAECETKRRIVRLEAFRWGSRVGMSDTLRLLAPPYADHPDYREEWKP